MGLYALSPSVQSESRSRSNAHLDHQFLHMMEKASPPLTIVIELLPLSTHQLGARGTAALPQQQEVQMLWRGGLFQALRMIWQMKQCTVKGLTRKSIVSSPVHSRNMQPWYAAAIL